MLERDPKFLQGPYQSNMPLPAPLGSPYAIVVIIITKTDRTLSNRLCACL